MTIGNDLDQANSPAENRQLRPATNDTMPARWFILPNRDRGASRPQLLLLVENVLLSLAVTQKRIRPRLRQEKTQVCSPPFKPLPVKPRESDELVTAFHAAFPQDSDRFVLENCEV
jgi:hypothetical protein